MKRCPSCNRTYTDEALNFCLEDGTPLVVDAPRNETSPKVVYPGARDTDPPATQIYQPPPSQQGPAISGQSAPYQQQQQQYQQPQYQQQRYQQQQYRAQYSPLPQMQRKKSSAVWWILGGLAVITVLGIGIIVILVAIASMSGSSNNNRVDTNLNSNNNRNTNSNRISTNANRDNTNTTTALPKSFSDNFSTQAWGSGSSQYGDTWYENDQYHMRSKDKLYLVMYAPSGGNYSSENATVQVTVRNVDGVSPAYGYGLLVHGAKSKDKGEIEDYGFLIRTGDSPSYAVVLHRGGKETPLVQWTNSDTIRGGTNTNQLEVRIKDTTLGFYINGQYATAITDSIPYKRGVVGFYTSDVHEVAFDDLEINR